MADGQPTPAQAPFGATMQPEYMGRRMKCYPVHESEMDSLATMNTQATTFFATGAAFIAYAVGIWTNASFYDHLTPIAAVASKIAAPLLLALAFVFFCLGAYTAWRRHGLWRRIKGESTILPALPPSA